MARARTPWTEQWQALKKRGEEVEQEQKRSTLASTWRFGEDLWRGPLLCVCSEVPWAGRQDFGCLCRASTDDSSPSSLFVLGGSSEQSGGTLHNDVWRSDDEGRTWKMISPHDPGRRDGSNLILKKWIGRDRFATAVSVGSKSSGFIYVVGGRGPRRQMADVWVSQSGGQHFRRTCEEAPFGARVDSSLAACPGSPMKILLSGGTTRFDLYNFGESAQVLDCWLSEDAGSSWTQVAAPDTVPRYSPKLHFTGESSILLLGGTSTAMISMSPQARERNFNSFSDAFKAEINWKLGSVDWQPIVVQTRDEKKLPDVHFNAAVVAGEYAREGLVAYTGIQKHRIVGSLLERVESSTADVMNCEIVKPIPDQIKGSLSVMLPRRMLTLVIIASNGVWATCSQAGRLEPSGPAAMLEMQVKYMRKLGVQMIERWNILLEIWQRITLLIFGEQGLRRF